MVEIKNLTKSYGNSSANAVEDLSISLRPGEIYGFLGSNGAGYNLPDTPENRTRIMADFEFYTNDEGSIFHG